MLPWIEIDTGPVPGCEAPLRLMQRGHEFSIFAGSNELMNSFRGGSEEALAVLACERLAGLRAPRILIGGLGMGFTLRAALASLGPDAHVAVAELVPKVIAWAKGPLAGVFKGCLEDPRVVLHEADVNRLIQSGPGAWDAILLDVDNGPECLTRRENDRLYDSWGVKRALWALSPQGVLGVWSGGPDRKFKARLQNGGFVVEEVRPRSGGRRGARHVVWLASRPNRTAAPTGRIPGR